MTRALVRALFAAEHFVFPAPYFASVEDDEVSRLRRAAVHVAEGLPESFPDGELKTLAQHLEFEAARPCIA